MIQWVMVPAVVIIKVIGNSLRGNERSNGGSAVIVLVSKPGN